MKTAPSPIAERLLSNKDVVFAFNVPVFAEWDKDDSFRECEQPARIGRILVDQLHRHLVNARIGYLFRERMAEHEKIKLAKASKVGAKLQYFSDLDFIVEVNWEAWKELSATQRLALIDHELCHFGVEETEKGTRHIILNHDLEEFGAIVTRWGFWQPDLTDFARAIQAQLELLPLASTVTLEMPGREPVTMTGDQLSRAAERVERLAAKRG